MFRKLSSCEEGGQPNTCWSILCCAISSQNIRPCVLLWWQPAADWEGRRWPQPPTREAGSQPLPLFSLCSSFQKCTESTSPQNPLERFGSDFRKVLTFLPFWDLHYYLKYFRNFTKAFNLFSMSLLQIWILVQCHTDTYIKIHQIYN